MATSKEDARHSNNNEERVVPFIFRAYSPKDNDLINYLRGVGNITKYIKELIREDIESKNQQD